MDMECSNLDSNQNTKENFSKSLIAVVRNFPILYDEHHVHYRHCKKRHYAWNEVAALLNSTSNECRWRWTTLRHSWNHQKGLIDSNKSHRKLFKYFDAMAFIDTVKKSRKEVEAETNLSKPSVYNTLSERSTDQDALLGYSQFVAGNVELSSTVTAQETPVKVEEVDLTMELDMNPVSSSCVDQSASNISVEMHGQSQAQPHKESSSLINSASNEFEDECLIAGRRIGYQLKSTDDFQRTIAEKLISDIVYNAKMGNLTGNSTITLNAIQPMPIQF